MLGDRIRVARERRGLTIHQLAALMECSSESIRGYERGRSVPGGESLRDMCLALGVRSDTLLGLPLRPGAPMAGAVAA
jgi:transcriptional regulator with XRE-family HTH domain